jgi:hypothetical protein
MAWELLKIEAFVITCLFSSHLRKRVLESIKVVAALFVHTQHEPDSHSSDLDVKLAVLSVVEPTFFRPELL